MRTYLVLALTLGMESAMAEGIVIEKVYGLELPGRYKHPASITQLDNGDLLLAYYGGSGEYEPDTAVYAGRLKAGDTTWSKPAPIADTPFHSDGNPVVWQAPDGVVWLFYVVRYGDTWSDSRIHAKISRDGADTWSDAFILADERGMMVRSKPIVLHDGDYLLPIYHETGHDREIVGADTTSLFLRCNPKTMKWSETNRIHSRLGCLQPAVAQINENDLIAFMRRGGGYEPCTDGWMVKSESHDGGRTWSEGEETDFPNPNSAIDLIRLANGHLVLVYNDNMDDRTPLTVAVSTDNGATWPVKQNIAEGPGPFAYPYAIQSQDGLIHVIYTTNDRTQIMRAVFPEEAVAR